MREGDYFRAIGVYKELEYGARDRDSAALYGYQICAAYRYSGHFELALQKGSDLLGRADLSQDLRKRTSMQVGLCHLQMNAPSFGAPYLETASSLDSTLVADVFLGLALVDDGRTDVAAGLTDNAARRMPEGAFRNIALDLRDAIASAHGIPRRNPIAIASISSIIPGLGQALCRHYVDALQAFTFVAAFGFTAYIANRYEVQNGAGRPLTAISLSLATLFHVANILGAYRTAEYFNVRQQDLHYQGIRDRVYEMHF